MADVIVEIKMREVINIPPMPLPDALDDFAATAVSASVINLSWTDNGDLAEFYDIQKDVNGSFTNNNPITTINSNPGSGGIFSITGLSSSTMYFFRIRASNITGYSAWVDVNETTL